MDWTHVADKEILKKVDPLPFLKFSKQWTERWVTEIIYASSRKKIIKQWNASRVNSFIVSKK